MYSIYLAIGVAAAIIVIPGLFDASLMTWTTLPGILIGVFTFVWINRRVAKRVEAVVGAADKEMLVAQQAARGAQNNPNHAKKAMGVAIERAVALLKRGFIFKNWQVGVGTMLNARVGMLLYMRWIVLEQKASLSEAIPYLEASRVTGRKSKLLHALWPAWAMLAVAYYKGKNDIDKAIGVFEGAIVAAPKEGLLWSMYGWILWKEKRRDEAVDVLARGRAKAPDDKRLAENLNLLQNGKKMLMRDYGEQWYQFGLEKPKMAGQKHRMAHPRMRGNRRR